MSVLGFVYPAISIGLGSLVLKQRRGFFPTNAPAISAQITVEEIHRDDLEITEHPVEQGATISDHAYKRPAEVIIRCMWSNSPSASRGLIGSAIGVAATLGGPIVGNVLAAGQTISAVQSLLTGNAADQCRQIYAQLLKLQEACEPFDVYTGKRVYNNMLFKSLVQETTEKTENALSIVAVCQQVIIVNVHTVSLPLNSAALADPEDTLPAEDVGQVTLQSAPTYTPDESTYGGTLDSLDSSFNEVNDIYGSIPAVDLAQITSSAVTTLPDVIGEAQTALGDVLSNLPSPSEIPTLSVPQELTVSLNGALSQAQATVSGAISGAQSALNEAMQALPSVLEAAQPAISDAIKQLPGVINQLPASFSNLTATLEGIQTQIGEAVRRTTEAIQRAPLPGI